jgi:hypothetical protein
MKQILRKLLIVGAVAILGFSFAIEGCKRKGKQWHGGWGYLKWRRFHRTGPYLYPSGRDDKLGTTEPGRPTATNSPYVERPDDRCNSDEHIKSIISKMIHLATSIYDLNKENTGEHFTKQLEESVEDLCNHWKKGKELTDDLKKCNISEHRRRSITNEWNHLLDFFNKRNIFYLIEDYHPRGYCEL